MKLNKLARMAFVEFIKTGAWSESLGNFEELVKVLPESSHSVWKKYGYKPPLWPLFLPVVSRTRSSSIEFSELETESILNSVRQKAAFDECHSYMQNRYLFKNKDLRSVLIAALLPIYLCSKEYLEIKEISGWDKKYDVEDLCVEEFLPTQKSCDLQRSERLFDWLLAAADTFSVAELDKSLADPHSSWVKEYKLALLNLPFTIYLSAVDTKTRRSKIVYSNAATNLGSDLHELFAEQCSPPGVAQVEYAVFNAKKYKRSILSEFNTCKLRALMPIYNADNDHVFTLAVDSYPFADPTCKLLEVNEQPFQHVENLMALLPLLIKKPLSTLN